MATVQFALPYRPAWDSNGKTIPGAQLYFTLSGTTTPATVYADAAMTEPLMNPVVANAAGRFVPIYYDEAIAIRARLYDEDDEAGVDAPLEDYNPYLGFATTTTVDAIARTDAATALAAANLKVPLKANHLDATAQPVGWWDDAGRYGLSSNGAGSSGFPATSGMTVSFKDSSALTATNYGRAFDLHKMKGFSRWFFRSYADATGIPDAFLEIKHGGNSVKTPMEFGCVGNGDAVTPTDDYANLLTALQSGFVIDGLGKTYALSAELKPTSFVGLRNAKFKWISTAAMKTLGKALLRIENLSNWFVEGCSFDMGTEEDVLSANDNARAGFACRSSAQTLSYLEHCRFVNNVAFGHGAGTAFELRNLRHSVVSGNIVRDRNVTHAGATNDLQNGIQLDSSTHLTVSNNIVTRLYYRNGSNVLVKLYSRGYCIGSVRNSTIVNNSVSFVDQGFDFSGGISMSHGTLGTVLGEPNKPNDGLGGNEDLTVTGNVAGDVGSRGFKFANVCRHSTIVGNVVRRYGLEGFGFSNGSSTLPDVNRNTSHLLVMGNQALNATGEQRDSTLGCMGFSIGEHSANVGWPRAIRLIGNTVAEPNSLGELDTGFSNRVTYDGSSGLFNELKDHKCSGHTLAAQSGFARLFCRVVGTGTQSITSSTPAVVLFATETEDTLGMHSTSSNTGRITAPEAGWYRATGVLQFAANGSGYRTANVLVGGGSAHTVIINAINGTVTNVPFTTELQLSANAYVEVQADQNSGGALNVERSNSTFSLEFVRYS